MQREQILLQLRERIVSFATSRGWRDHAEDLAQEVMIVLHEKYSNVAALDDLVPLAFQVLRFKMLDLHRKALRRGEYNQKSVETLNLPDPADDPPTQLDRKRQVERLLVALDQVGDRCRELFRLKLEGRSFPEIQKLMHQTSINTIYTWDYRCRKQLLELLGGKWE